MSIGYAIFRAYVYTIENLVWLCHFVAIPNTLFGHYLDTGFNQSTHETQVSHTPARAGGNQGPWVSRACLGTLSGHPCTWTLDRHMSAEWWWGGRTVVQWHSGADLGVGVWSVRGATRLISKLFACLPQNRKSVVGGTIFFDYV